MAWAALKLTLCAVLCRAVQLQESQPFILELLGGLGDTIQDLQPHQIHTFYESVGLMIGAEGDAAKRDDYLVRQAGAAQHGAWHGGALH